MTRNQIRITLLSGERRLIAVLHLNVECTS
jgi:hypothetical protein